MENKYRDLHDLPMILRVEDLMPILGIGRNTAYELIRSGRYGVSALVGKFVFREMPCWSSYGSKSLCRQKFF